MTYDETDVEQIALQLLDRAGVPRPFTAASLQALDQYHLGGVRAVDLLIEDLNGYLHGVPAPRILDVGSGLGGPARHLARTGARVHGIDITSSYVRAAQSLTDLSADAPRVTFEHADIETMAAADPYVAAVTIHVQMNIHDKLAWYRAIAEHLLPGGVLALWDICITDTAARPTYPQPWSLDGSDSHLVTPDELLDVITTAGYELLTWHDRTEAVLESLPTTPPTNAAGALPQLLNDGLTRTANLTRAVRSGQVTVIQASFKRR